MSVPGKLIAFEGCEAVGKTTQMRRVAAELRRRGYPVLETVEPGGTHVGMQIRHLVLSARGEGDETVHPLTSLLLFNAARHQLMREVVKPKLAEGYVVLSDRSFLTSVVYQGHAEGMSIDQVERICMMALDGVFPDTIFLFDVPIEVMIGRLRALRGEKTTRYDTMMDTFHRTAKKGYLDEVLRRPDLIEVVNGEAAPEAITERLVRRIVEIIDP